MVMQAQKIKLSVVHAGEQPGMSGLEPSYLSIDVDGRVARLDTFSKFLVPGLRLGWLTAHPTLLSKCCVTLQGATVGPPGISQVDDWLQ